MSFKKLFIVFTLLAYCSAKQNYSLKELNSLLIIEYATLTAQEKLLAKNHNNENVKKAIKMTITRIKKRINKLEMQKIISSQ